MSRVLIVAYGNPLRSDDGLAWHAAEQLEGKFPPEEVEILSVQQLGPELAELASHSECTIFLDAADSGEPGDVQVTNLSADRTGPPQPSRFSHALSPATILGMASQLYSGRPQAFLATLCGQHFEHGESLSPVVQATLPTFVARIEELAHTSLTHREES